MPQPAIPILTTDVFIVPVSDLASRCFRLLSNQMTHIDFGLIRDRFSHAASSQQYAAPFVKSLYHHVKSLFSFPSLGGDDTAIFALFSSAFRRSPIRIDRRPIRAAACHRVTTQAIALT